MEKKARENSNASHNFTDAMNANAQITESENLCEFKLPLDAHLGLDDANRLHRSSLFFFAANSIVTELLQFGNNDDMPHLSVLALSNTSMQRQSMVPGIFMRYRLFAPIHKITISGRNATFRPMSIT